MRTIFLKVVNESAPCDDCGKKIYCKYRDVACEAFKQYTNTGKIKDLPRIPNVMIYSKLYYEDITL